MGASAVPHSLIRALGFSKLVPLLMPNGEHVERVSSILDSVQFSSILSFLGRCSEAFVLGKSASWKTAFFSDQCSNLSDKMDVIFASGVIEISIELDKINKIIYTLVLWEVGI